VKQYKRSVLIQYGAKVIEELYIPSEEAPKAEEVHNIYKEELPVIVIEVEHSMALYKRKETFEKMMKWKMQGLWAQIIIIVLGACSCLLATIHR